MMKAMHDKKLLENIKNIGESTDGLAMIEWVKESRDFYLTQSTLGEDRDARISLGDKAAVLSEILQAFEEAPVELKAISMNGTSQINGHPFV